MMFQHRPAVLLLVLFLASSTHAFTNTKVSSVITGTNIRGKGFVAVGDKNAPANRFHLVPQSPVYTHRGEGRVGAAVLYAEKKDSRSIYEDSEKRGTILFGIVLAILVWSFSIPKELRRDHICFDRKCRLDNTGDLCYNCISFSEWTTKIADYYKGGGGINFDFSIEGKD